MELTKEYLLSLKEQAEGEQRRLISHMQQSVGAIAMIDALLIRLAAEEPKQEEANGKSTSSKTK